MNAHQLYQSGRLDEAIGALGVVLRDDPTNVRQRTFLFELLCFAGEYDRAEKQLDVIAQGSQEAAMGALLYRSALHAERLRQQMFAGQLEKPPATEAAQVSGTLNGRAFSSISDADPRVGARLEVFAAGQYTWVPFSHLATIRIDSPKRLRDLLWSPAMVRAGAEFQDFEFGEMLVPVLSPLSWQSSDDEVRLGRVTDWETLADEVDIPVGQKLLRVDDELVPILEVRELDISPSP
ncbi:MAG: tetratricopeptide repeat protein [Gemmatimonas sp.]|nr:tetratricopeptide repeat protein [Gemmatimonas sp.]